MDVISAVKSNPPKLDKFPEFHKVYTDGVLRIFLGGPDTIPALVKSYDGSFLRVFIPGPA